MEYDYQPGVHEVRSCNSEIARLNKNIEELRTEKKERDARIAEIEAEGRKRWPGMYAQQEHQQQMKTWLFGEFVND